MKIIPSGAIWGLINKAKNKGETCEIYARLYGTFYNTKDIATLYTAYEAELKKLNLVVRHHNILFNARQNDKRSHFKDFDNLLIKACELLRKKRYVLSHIEAILVDEVREREGGGVRSRESLRIFG